MGLSSVVRDIEYRRPNCEGCGLRRKWVEEAVQPALALWLEAASTQKERLPVAQQCSLGDHTVVWSKSFLV